jgi:hypothetical protein
VRVNNQEVTRDDKLYILPLPRVYQPAGELEVVFDLEQAKQQADGEAREHHQHRYVHRYKEGYVVVGYSDMWAYFGAGDQDNELVVYHVEPA